MNAIDVNVVRKLQEAEEFFTYELVRPQGGQLPTFSAGSHVDVYVNSSVTRRAYLSNDPKEKHHYLIGELCSSDLESRGGSQEMPEMLNVGDIIQISAPKNHFPLFLAKRTLLFAMDVGVTPLLCMAERLAEFQADFALHYCVRSPERAAFLSRIKSSTFSRSVHLYFDSGELAQKLDLVTILAEHGTDTKIYACGPVDFIDYVSGTARQLGWESGEIQTECFAV